jgi:type I site-specific restriction-modification system R (restriction) subunit
VIQLNLPDFELKTRTVNGKLQVFDTVRRKFVALTPEEWVRQHYVNFLNIYKGVPISHIAVEKQLKVNNLSKRADIVVFKGGQQPILAIEVKAPSVDINEDVFHQLLRYNMPMHVDYLGVTNGLRHVYCKIDYQLQKAVYMEDLPDYVSL